MCFDDGEWWWWWRSAGLGLAQLGTKFLASQLTPKPTPQLEHDADDDHADAGDHAEAGDHADDDQTEAGDHDYGACPFEFEWVDLASLGN